MIKFEYMNIFVQLIRHAIYAGIARDQSPTLGRPAGVLETNPFTFRDKTGCARCIGRWLVLETNPPSRAGTGARCIGRGLE